MNKDEIEARALELYPERKRQNKKGTGEYDANLPRRKAYIKGWTDAQPTLPGDSPLTDHHQSSKKKRTKRISNYDEQRDNRPLG